MSSATQSSPITVSSQDNKINKAISKESEAVTKAKNPASPIEPESSYHVSENCQEVVRLLNALEAIPENLRQDKIAEMKEKLKNPNYPSKEDLDRLASILSN